MLLPPQSTTYSHIYYLQPTIDDRVVYLDEAFRQGLKGNARLCPLLVRNLLHLRNFVYIYCLFSSHLFNSFSNYKVESLLFSILM
jgi:hypothetical protein